MRWLYGVALSVSVVALPGALRAQTSEQQLSHARELLRATEVEEAVAALRALIGSLPEDSAHGVGIDARVEMAAGSAFLGMSDSADHYFSEVVRLDPFYELEPERFNSTIDSLFKSARRRTTVVAVRLPSDTIIRPDEDEWPADVAVGAPGLLTIRFVPLDSGSVSEQELAQSVDESSVVRISLMIDDTYALRPGRYTVSFDLVAASGERASTAADITLIGQPVDTTLHVPPPSDAVFLPEFRKGPIERMSILSGIAVGIAAVALPSVLTSSELSSASLDYRAVTAGAAVSVAGVLGAFVGRRDLPIQENIDHNNRLRSDWQAQNARVAAENERLIRLAPLRIRLETEP